MKKNQWFKYKSYFFSYKKLIFKKSKIISSIGFFELFHLEYSYFQKKNPKFSSYCGKTVKKSGKNRFFPLFSIKNTNIENVE